MSKHVLSKCKQVVNLSQKLSKEMDELRKMFVDRYGIDWNDADCEWLIDAFDYASGGIKNLAQIDMLMTESGHPPIGEAGKS